MRFIEVAADQVGIFVGFEIGQAHDGFARINRCSQRRHAFGNFIDIEIDRRGITCDAAGDFGLQFVVQAVKFQQGFRVDTDLAVNDELHARQADTFAGQAGEAECQFGVADVHHDFDGCFGHIVQSDIGNLHIQQSGVNQAGIAFGAGYGYVLAV